MLIIVQSFQEIIHSNLGRYFEDATATMERKRAIVMEIVHFMEVNGRHFLKEKNVDDAVIWERLSVEATRQKVAHALQYQQRALLNGHWRNQMAGNLTGLAYDNTNGDSICRQENEMPANDSAAGKDTNKKSPHRRREPWKTEPRNDTSFYRDSDLAVGTCGSRNHADRYVADTNTNTSVESKPDGGRAHMSVRDCLLQCNAEHRDESWVFQISELDSVAVSHIEIGGSFDDLLHAADVSIMATESDQDWNKATSMHTSDKTDNALYSPIPVQFRSSMDVNVEDAMVSDLKLNGKAVRRGLPFSD